mmetsp:Transcript_2990/g.7445  ORF Transcript_2990/g.7445 Transcript_2990/m.7445 type:complete len:248 (-) Transcript_2990:85-828(-)
MEAEIYTYWKLGNKKRVVSVSRAPGHEVVNLVTILCKLNRAPQSHKNNIEATEPALRHEVVDRGGEIVPHAPRGVDRLHLVPSPVRVPSLSIEQHALALGLINEVHLDLHLGRTGCRDAVLCQLLVVLQDNSIEHKPLPLVRVLRYLLLKQHLKVLDDKILLELHNVHVVSALKRRIERVVPVPILRHADRAHANGLAVVERGRQPPPHRVPGHGPVPVRAYAVPFHHLDRQPRGGHPAAPAPARVL